MHELGSTPPDKGLCRLHAEVLVVDECHRTQSGKLHRAMKAIPSATLIGFTGTPLLRADKLRSIETFGPYIHTYKLASGDYVDLKVFEPAMRHLLDTYIRAEDRRCSMR